MQLGVLHGAEMDAFLDPIGEEHRDQLLVAHSTTSAPFIASCGEGAGDHADAGRFLHLACERFAPCPIGAEAAHLPDLAHRDDRPHLGGGLPPAAQHRNLAGIGAARYFAAQSVVAPTRMRWMTRPERSPGVRRQRAEQEHEPHETAHWGSPDADFLGMALIVLGPGQNLGRSDGLPPHRETGRRRPWT